MSTHASKIKKFKSKSCCCICGFNYNKDVLEFHHLDPKDKTANVSSMNSYSTKKLMNEIRKTVLLCRNCHRLIHFDKDFQETYTYSELKAYKGVRCSISNCLSNKWKKIL